VGTGIVTDNYDTGKVGQKKVVAGCTSCGGAAAAVLVDSRHGCDGVVLLVVVKADCDWSSAIFWICLD